MAGIDDTWDAFVAANGGSIEQSAVLVEALRERGARPVALVAGDPADPTCTAAFAAHPRALGQHVLHCHRGPTFAAATAADPAARADAFADLLTAVRNTGRELRAPVARFDLAPTSPLTAAELERHGLQPAAEAELRRAVWIVDLPREDLATVLGPRARRNIRRAEREEITVRWATSGDDIRTFTTMLGDTASRQSFDAPPASYVSAVAEGLAREGRGGVMLAEHAGVPVAGVLVGWLGAEATYLLGASLPEGQAVRAPYLLQREAMKAASAAGARTYDMTYLAPDDDPGHRLAGLRQFKTSFVGRAVHPLPIQELVLSPWRHRLARTAARVRG